MLLSYKALDVQHGDIRTTNHVSIFISLVFYVSVEPTIPLCVEAKPPTPPLVLSLPSTASPQMQLSLFFLTIFGLIHLPTLFLLCLQPPV